MNGCHDWYEINNSPKCMHGILHDRTCDLCILFKRLGQLERSFDAYKRLEKRPLTCKRCEKESFDHE